MVVFCLADAAQHNTVISQLCNHLRQRDAAGRLVNHWAAGTATWQAAWGQDWRTLCWIEKYHTNRLIRMVSDLVLLL